MFKNLLKLVSRKSEFNEVDQSAIDSLLTESTSLQALGEMKATGGWKLLSQKIHEELSAEIKEELKGNVKITTLLNILATVETKEATKLLEEEIAKIIPE